MCQSNASVGQERCSDMISVGSSNRRDGTKHKCTHAHTLTHTQHSWLLDSQLMSIYLPERDAHLNGSVHHLLLNGNGDNLVRLQLPLSHALICSCFFLLAVESVLASGRSPWDPLLAGLSDVQMMRCRWWRCPSRWVCQAHTHLLEILQSVCVVEGGGGVGLSMIPVNWIDSACVIETKTHC